jgi:two-component system sensor histidine kinase UhpB
MLKKKIFIIEDDPVIARDLAKILSGIGYLVTTFSSVNKRLLWRVKQDMPDLVFIGLAPRDKCQGIESGRKIRQKLDIPIVFLTAHSDKKTIKMTLKAQSFGCLLKPVDKKTLEMVIAVALSRHAEEKKLKESLLESENRYRQLVDNISEGIVIQDKDGNVTFANDRFLGILGYKREEVLQRPITKLFGEGWLKKSEESKASPGETRWRSVELGWRKKDRSRVYTLFSRQPIYDAKGQIQGSVAVLTDITDRREAEIELRRSHEALRSLSQHIQSVREEESKRIASEIHDELGQQLTALKIDLSWLSSRVPSPEKNGTQILDKIHQMDRLVDYTIQTVQKISAELRPVLLDDLGLAPAIEWLAQDFENRTKIKCRVNISIDEIDLNLECSTAIFRISQEALTNVARHAKATCVDISLKERNGGLILNIADNGKGINHDEINAPSSLGLMGMRERVRPFGGEVSIGGSRRGGTTVTVVVPLGKA